MPTSERREFGVGFCGRTIAALVGLWGATSGSTRAAQKEERWLRATVQDFTVLTPLDEAAAKKVAAEFGQYVAALRTIFQGEHVKLPPLTIVAFGRARDFDAYKPLRANGKPQDISGLFMRRESWAVAGLSLEMSEESRHTVFHEGVHWFLSTTNRIKPLWFEEGVAEVLATFRIEKKQAAWGQPIEGHVDLLRESNALKIDQLISVRREELFRDDSLRTQLIYAKAWLFTHFLFFAKYDFPREALSRYLALMNEGVGPAEAFPRAFGRGVQEMEWLLEDYLRGGTYHMAHRPLAQVEVPTVEPATKFAVDDALGRLALVAGRHETAARHAREMIALAPDDPRGHGVLGFALDAAGDKAEALVEFERSANAGSQDSLVWFALGEAEGVRLMNFPGNPEAPEIARRGMERHKRASEIYPNARANYEELASLVLRVKRVVPEDRGALARGARLFPDDFVIQIGLAQLSRLEGDKARARTELDAVLAAMQQKADGGLLWARSVAAAWAAEDARNPSGPRPREDLDAPARDNSAPKPDAGAK